MVAETAPRPDRCICPVGCYSTQAVALRASGALIDPVPVETQLAYDRMSDVTPVYRPVSPANRRAAGGDA